MIPGWTDSTGPGRRDRGTAAGLSGRSPESDRASGSSDGVPAPRPARGGGGGGGGFASPRVPHASRFSSALRLERCFRFRSSLWFPSLINWPRRDQPELETVGCAATAAPTAQFLLRWFWVVEDCPGVSLPPPAGSECNCRRRVT